MTGIEIRPLTRKDETDWRRLWTAYLAFYDTDLPEAVYRASFDRMIATDAREFRGLIATVDGQALGLAHYLFHRNGWTIKDTCYLQDLFVDPAARGTGLGRRLIQAVYDAADRHGAASVYWLTQDFNATARQLYDRIARKTPFIVYER